MLKGFRCVLPIEIRFRDMDALGHVNNVVYLTYMESDYGQKRSTPIPERLRLQILAYDEGVTSEEPRS